MKYRILGLSGQSQKQYYETLVTKFVVSTPVRHAKFHGKLKHLSTAQLVKPGACSEESSPASQFKRSNVLTSVRKLAETPRARVSVRASVAHIHSLAYS